MHVLLLGELEDQQCSWLPGWHTYAFKSITADQSAQLCRCLVNGLTDEAGGQDLDIRTSIIFVKEREKEVRVQLALAHGDMPMRGSSANVEMAVQQYRTRGVHSPSPE